MAAKKDPHICEISFVGGPEDGKGNRFVEPPPETLKMDLGRALYRKTRTLEPIKSGKKKVPHYEFEYDPE